MAVSVIFHRLQLLACHLFGVPATKDEAIAGTDSQNVVSLIFNVF